MDAEQSRRYYTYIIPFITLFGLHDGWLAYKNESLQESVAVHAWYDFNPVSRPSSCNERLDKTDQTTVFRYHSVLSPVLKILGLSLVLLRLFSGFKGA